MYTAHQTIIILVGCWLKPFRLGTGIEFGILLVTTIAGCALAYEFARRSDWVLPFFGLKPPALAASKKGALPFTGNPVLHFPKLLRNVVE